MSQFRPYEPPIPPEGSPRCCGGCGESWRFVVDALSLVNLRTLQLHRQQDRTPPVQIDPDHPDRAREALAANHSGINPGERIYTVIPRHSFPSPALAMGVPSRESPAGSAPCPSPRRVVSCWPQIAQAVGVVEFRATR